MKKIEIGPVLNLFIQRGAIAKIPMSQLAKNELNRINKERGYSLFGVTDIPNIKARTLFTLLEMEAESKGEKAVDMTAILAPRTQGYVCFKVNGQIREILTTAIKEGDEACK